MRGMKRVLHAAAAAAGVGAYAARCYVSGAAPMAERSRDAGIARYVAGRQRSAKGGKSAALANGGRRRCSRIP
jgi:ribosomal protein L18